ncbi:hypothetical protein J6590_063136 [Homalodisca vitripennis]|nr:hypothetical protein J6590_063136 [Homalodisca vitripennis]
MDTQTAPSSRIPPLYIDSFQGWHGHAAEIHKITGGDFHAVCKQSQRVWEAPGCAWPMLQLRRAAQRDLPRLPEILGIAPRRQPVKGQPLSQAARAALPLAGRAAQSQRTTRPAVTCSAATWSAPPPLDESGDQPMPAIPPTANAQFSDPAPLEPSIYGELRTDDHGEEDDSETEKESRRRRRLPRNPANRTTGPRTWAKAVKAPDYPQKTA